MARLRTIGKVEPVPKRWLSAKETMAYLGIGSEKLESLRNSAEFIFSKHERTIWYELDSINRFLERNRVV